MEGNIRIHELATSSPSDGQWSNGTHYIVILLFFIFLVLAAWFLYPCLGFTIKFLCSLICGTRKRVVGIFSYSSPEDYHWITQGLNSMQFRGYIKSTSPSIISPHSRAKFEQAVEQCDFAILYHTRNRGRVNLTNVTDSLYDEELRYMSTRKGRLNVIVVIDDLEQNDYEQKRHILQNQPDIADYARDLVLVSSADKRNRMNIDNKLQHIIDLMSNGSRNPVQYCDYLYSMALCIRRTVSQGCPRNGSGELDAPLLV